MYDSSVIDQSLPSSVLEPLGTTESWLLEFIGLDLEAEDAVSKDLQPMFAQEEAHNKRPYVSPNLMLRELLGIPSHLTVMLSSEDDQEIPNEDTENNQMDKVRSLNNELDSEEFPGIQELEACAILLDGSSLIAHDEEMLCRPPQ